METGYLSQFDKSEQNDKNRMVLTTQWIYNKIGKHLSEQLHQNNCLPQTSSAGLFKNIHFVFGQ